jgi:hypothetical protein
MKSRCERIKRAVRIDGQRSHTSGGASRLDGRCIRLRGGGGGGGPRTLG